MIKIRRNLLILSLVLLLALLLSLLLREGDSLNAEPQSILLALPEIEIEEDLNRLIYHRRSIRSYSEGLMTPYEVGELLFAALGITIDGLTGATRAAPSAGATNPLVLYAYVDSVEGMEKGLYQYHPSSHELEHVLKGDLGEELEALALNQSSVGEAQLVLLITADFERTTRRYGERGRRYVYMEAGHGAQNILLKAEELDLGAVVIGAFYEEEVQEFLSLNEEPLLILPIGLTE